MTTNADRAAPFAGKGHKPVGKLAQGLNPAGDAIVALLRADRQEWTLIDWQEALDTLYGSTDSLDDWLAIRL